MQELRASFRASRAVTPTDLRDPQAPPQHLVKEEIIIKKKRLREENQTKHKRIETLGFAFPSSKHNIF